MSFPPPDKRCPTCLGDGIEPSARLNEWHFHDRDYPPCRTCDGLGMVGPGATATVLGRRRPCPTLGCDGFGTITDERVINGDYAVVVVGHCPLHLGSCDWGDCDEPSTTYRLSPEHGWLPVCPLHAEPVSR